MTTTMTHAEILKFVESQPIRISVFGEFSSGKTTFINAIIGEAILSVAVDPTTAVPTYIRYAKEFNILVQLHTGESLELFDEEPPFWTRFVGRKSVLHTLKKQEGEIRNFLKEWTKEGERANEVQNIIIELPLPWLKKNVELVDTPGTNAGIDTHKDHTDQVSKETDLAIFLMDARQGGGKKTEFVFMNDVQSRVSQSFVVVNKMDLLDEEDDEREDILDFITNEAIPKHWSGIVHPQIFGISSLVRLDKDLAGNELSLLDEFSRLITILEEIATTQRGKILLNRIGNPEKELFKQATQYEAEKLYDKAHRKFFDLIEILQSADMNTEPAVKGIERCEAVLDTQVSELNKLNSKINDTLALEEKEPDKAIDLLCQMQKRLDKINAPDTEVDDAIKRLLKRLKRRDRARKSIRECELSAVKSKNIDRHIYAAEQFSKVHSYIVTAELSEKELQRIKEYEENLVQERDDFCLQSWIKTQKSILALFKKHVYLIVVSQVERIDKISQFLPADERMNSKKLIMLAKEKYENWELYKTLIKNVKSKILTEFMENAVNISFIRGLGGDFRELSKLSEEFTKEPISYSLKFSNKDKLLQIDERIYVVRFMLQASTLFDQEELTALKDRLEARKSELAKIPSDSKFWFNNPEYFLNYPDHRSALLSISDLVISNNLKTKEVFQLLTGLNYIKPYCNLETAKKIQDQENALTDILLRNRIFTLKTKKSLAYELIKSKLFSSAISVAEKIGPTYSKLSILSHITDEQEAAGDLKGSLQTELKISNIVSTEREQIKHLYPSSKFINPTAIFASIARKQASLRDFDRNIIASCKNRQNVKQIDACTSKKCVSKYKITCRDIDGNEYKTVKIGNQTWMAENLKVTHFRNGDPISPRYSDNEWKKLDTAAYAVYDNEPVNAETYGHIYNWYAVRDVRSICPEGFHVPTDEEWSELTDFLGVNAGSQLAGHAELWSSCELTYNPGFGSSRFDVLPGGYRYNYNGTCYYMGRIGYFWSYTPYNSGNAWCLKLDRNDSGVTRYSLHKRFGFSVRCLGN
ncbi:MAG: hypothetical protein HOK84_18825 [Bacteroidetes bacterium]|jgi:uncharacterized protein (TIGR02145 family)|nr:hypothetical protein [Bacteroidota bacterium]